MATSRAAPGSSSRRIRVPRWARPRFPLAGLRSGMESEPAVSFSTHPHPFPVFFFPWTLQHHHLLSHSSSSNFTLQQKAASTPHTLTRARAQKPTQVLLRSDRDRRLDVDGAHADRARRAHPGTDATTASAGHGTVPSPVVGGDSGRLYERQWDGPGRSADGRAVGSRYWCKDYFPPAKACALEVAEQEVDSGVTAEHGTRHVEWEEQLQQQ